ncbi:hypothetical protein TNCV_3802941 [Trichonephila clavipes]|nr:hypothetical protein TNCV_3802941 [Trichonephila clavipes]
MGDKKTSDRANCKGQLALTVHGKRRLRRIVCSKQSQTEAQIITQLNDGASRIVSKWTVQSLAPYGFREPSTYESTIAQCSLFGLHVLPELESPD